MAGCYGDHRSGRVSFRKDGEGPLSLLVQQRCMIHLNREAAVRCPRCQRFYCRECVVEHDGRMMCAHCIAQFEAAPDRDGSSVALWGILSLTGFLAAWLIFYYFGMALARLPSSFFGGTP
jgi:hypothetical protein